MKLKLDENLGQRVAATLRGAGHDVATVVEQNLCGATDVLVAAACVSEERCLVTLDLDFANPLRFRPAGHPGIAVMRLPRRPGAGDLHACVETFIEALGSRAIQGKLWIVQRGRIREYIEPDDT